MIIPVKNWYNLNIIYNFIFVLKVSFVKTHVHVNPTSFCGSLGGIISELRRAEGGSTRGRHAGFDER